MLSKIKSLTKESAVYGAGHILSRSIGFLLLPVHTNYIAPAEYGLAAVLFAYLVLALVFYTYGMDSAFLRYYILAEGIDEKKRIFSSAFWSVLFVSALFSGMSIALSDGLAVLVFEQARAGYFVQLCAGILFFDAIAVLPFLVLRAEKKKHAVCRFENHRRGGQLYFEHLLYHPGRQGHRGHFPCQFIFIRLLLRNGRFDHLRESSSLLFTA
jgi:hypothetical protein